MSTRDQTLLGYFGGKVAMAPTIVSMMPPYRRYVELFGGMAAVLMNKPRWPEEIYNDLADELCNLLEVVRDNRTELELALSLTPYSRTEYKNSLAKMRLHRKGKLELPRIERARVAYVVLAQSWAASLIGKGWGHGGPKHDGSVAATFVSRLDRISAVSKRLQGVIIENINALLLARRYKTADTLLFVDPPYVMSTRNARGYLNEMTDEEHQQLIELLLAHPGGVILCGYKCQIYEQLEAAGWERRDFDTVAHSGAARGGKRGSKRVESLWLNPQVAAWNRQQIDFIVQPKFDFTLSPSLNHEPNRPLATV